MTVHEIPIHALAEADGVFFLTMAKGDRLSIATTIERLIEMLDAMDPDPDLEPYHYGDDREGDEGCEQGDCDREPSLGWAANGEHGRAPNAHVSGLDLEADDADDEPTLGAPENHPVAEYGPRRAKEGDQRGWFCGSGADGESEPTMGSCDRQAQEAWGSLGYDAFDCECEDVSEDEGAQDDREPDHDDEPFLGWSERDGQGPKIGIEASPNDFTYDGDGLYDGGSSGALDFNGDGCIAARTVLRNLKAIRPDVEQDYVGGFCMGNHSALVVDRLAIKSGKGRQRLGPDELTILRPGVAMVGGYRVVPEIDSVANIRPLRGPTT